jgi:hypothetical protein
MGSKYFFRNIYTHKIYELVLTLFIFISPKYELPSVQRDHDGPEDEGTQKYSIENEEVNYYY